MLRAEVLHSCLYDQPLRFQLSHAFLMRMHGLRYEHSSFHHLNMDNLLLVALSAEAWQVTRFLLLTVDPEVILWTCKNEQCEGMTVLHLAVMKDRRDLVGVMMERLNPQQRETLIASQGTGRIFRGHFNNCSNPTTLALHCGQSDIFFDLIRFGGDVSRIDTLSGNGPMHILVEYGTMRPEKAREFLHEVLTSPVTISWFCTKYGIPRNQFTPHQHNLLKALLLKERNFEGYTALTYSAKLGVHPVLAYIMNCEGVYKHTQWRLGARSCALYDMTELDPTVTRLQTPYTPSALELLLYENCDQELPVLSEQPLRQLLKTKWRQHRVQYTLMAAFHLLVLCLQTSIAVTVATQRSRGVPNITQGNLSFMNDSIYGRLLIQGGSILVSGIVALYAIMELYELWLCLSLYVKGRLFWRWFKHYYVPWSLILKLDEYDVFMIIYCGASITWLPQLFYGSYIGGGLFLGLALVSGWYFMLFYTRAYQATSFFNVMLSRMLFTDLPIFTVAMGVLLVGFGVSIMVLLAQPLPQGFSSFGDTITTMVLLMVGMANVGFIGSSKQSVAATIYGLIYVILGAILLLNMLTAALADTYASYSDSRHPLWLKMRVRNVLVLERRSLNCFLRWRLHRIMEYSDKEKIWYLRVEDSPATKNKTGLGQLLSRSFKHWWHDTNICLNLACYISILHDMILSFLFSLCVVC